MNESRRSALRATGFDLLRSLLSFLSFLLISGLLSGGFLLAGFALVNELNVERHPLYIAAAILLPLSFYSIHRAFELYDKGAQEAFPFDSIERYGFLSGMGILFKTPTLRRKLLISLLTLNLLIIILPYEVGFKWLIGAIYPAFDMPRGVAELTCSLIACPILSAVLILAKTSAHKWWVIAPTGERDRILGDRRKNRNLALELLKITVIYGIGFPVLPSVFMLALSMVLTFGKFALGFWISLAVILVILASLRSLIAIGRRCRFLRRMKHSLKAEGYTLSKIQRPILSVFLPDMDEDFTVSRDGVTYTCKLIGSTHRRRPMYISPSGVITERHTVTFMKITLFHIMHDTHYTVAGENRIIILTPLPKRVFINYGRTDTAFDDGDGGNLLSYYSTVAYAKGGGYKQSRATDRRIHGPGYISDLDRGIIKPFETGERIGGVKFFTPSGFISAIDNGCLDR